MKVEFRSSFVRDLKRVRDQSVKRRVKPTIEHTEEVDTLRKVNGVRKLSISGNYYRVRIGDYRLGLLLREKTVVFIRRLPRRDIYHYFP